MEGLDAIIQLVLIGSACLYPVGVLFACFGCCPEIVYETVCGCLEFEFVEKLPVPEFNVRHSCDEGTVDGQHYQIVERVPVHGWSGGARTSFEAGVRERCAAYRVRTLLDVYDEASLYRRPNDGDLIYPGNLSAGETASRSAVMKLIHDESEDRCDSGDGNPEWDEEVIEVKTINVVVNGYDVVPDHEPVGQGAIPSFSPAVSTVPAKVMPKSNGEYTPQARSLSTPISITLESAEIAGGDLTKFDGSVLTQQTLLSMASVAVSYFDGPTESRYDATYTYQANPTVFRYSGFLSVNYLYKIVHGDKTVYRTAGVSWNLSGFSFDPLPEEGLPPVTVPPLSPSPAAPSETATVVESAAESSGTVNVVVQVGDTFPPSGVQYALPDTVVTPAGQQKIGNSMILDHGEETARSPIAIETECDGVTKIWGAPCIASDLVNRALPGIAANIASSAEQIPDFSTSGKWWAKTVSKPAYEFRNYSFDESLVDGFLARQNSLSYYTTQVSPGASIIDPDAYPLSDSLSELTEPIVTPDMEVRVELDDDLLHCGESVCGGFGDLRSAFGSGGIREGAYSIPWSRIPSALDAVTPPTVTVSYSGKRSANFVGDKTALCESGGSVTVTRVGCVIPFIEIPYGCKYYVAGSTVRSYTRAPGNGFGNILENFACGDLRWVLANGFCRQTIKNRSQHLSPVSSEGCVEPERMDFALGGGDPTQVRFGCIGPGGPYASDYGLGCPDSQFSVSIAGTGSPLDGTYVVELGSLVSPSPCYPAYGFSFYDEETTEYITVYYSESWFASALDVCPEKQRFLNATRTKQNNDGTREYTQLDTESGDSNSLVGFDSVYRGNFPVFIEQIEGVYSGQPGRGGNVFSVSTQFEFLESSPYNTGERSEWANFPELIIRAGDQYVSADVLQTWPVGLLGVFPEETFTGTLRTFNAGGSEQTIDVASGNQILSSATQNAVNRDDIGPDETPPFNLLFATTYPEDTSQDAASRASAPGEVNLATRTIRLTRASGSLLETSNGLLWFPGRTAACVAVGEGSEWLQIISDGGGVGAVAFTLDVSVTENTTGAPRTATLIATVGAFSEVWTIIQPAFDFAATVTEVEGIPAGVEEPILYTNANSITVKGTSKPLSRVVVSSGLFFNYDSVETASDDFGRWQAELPLGLTPDGQQYINAKCFWGDGNDQYYGANVPALDRTALVVVDRIAPLKPLITQPAGGAEVDPLVSVTVSCEEEAEVRLFADGVLKDTLERGGTSVVGSVSGLSLGSHTITATATDRAGNVSPSSDPVTVEVVA